MSKRAEEAALKAYPDKEVNGVSLVFGEQRRLFQEGYELAEQAFALTAEDVGCIYNLVLQMKNKYNATSACYQEVADIFNKDREEEENDTRRT